MSVKLGISH